MKSDRKNIWIDKDTSQLLHKVKIASKKNKKRLSIKNSRDNRIPIIKFRNIESIKIYKQQITQKDKATKKKYWRDA